MEPNFGSLEGFLKHIPEIKSNVTYFQRVRSSFNKISSKQIPLPSSKSSSFKAKTISLNRKVERKPESSRRTRDFNESFQLASKLSPSEQMRNELMLDKRHVLLRSMRVDLRTEEQKQNSAKLEHQGLTKLLNTFRRSSKKNDYFKFTPFKPIIFTPKAALNRSLLEDRQTWMYKHGFFNQ